MLALRHAAARGPPRAPERPGHRARHLQPPPRGAARRRGRPHLQCRSSTWRAAQGRFEIFDTPLAETAPLGFEYGYSTADPHTLVVWEAQFGDFVNVAQVYVDQFLASAESKWRRMSGLTLLLPHGYEGQGPEHSSARLERFLELCARCNLQVVNLTTPAQLFHALRRQMHRRFRKPLVVMSPKSLLRHRAAVSPVREFTHGYFRTVIDDATVADPGAVRGRPARLRASSTTRCEEARAARPASRRRAGARRAALPVPARRAGGAARAATRARARCAGCRRSRPTWEPGAARATGSRPSCRRATRLRLRGAPGRADAGDGQLPRPRRAGARAAGARPGAVRARAQARAPAPDAGKEARRERRGQVPRLAESIADATLVEWLKGDGEPVRVDEPIATLETDKAAVEIAATETGVLRHARTVGDVVRVGDVLAPHRARRRPAAPAAARAAPAPRRPRRRAARRRAAPPPPRRRPRRRTPARPGRAPPGRGARPRPGRASPAPARAGASSRRTCCGTSSGRRLPAVPAAGRRGARRRAAAPRPPTRASGVVPDEPHPPAHRRAPGAGPARRPRSSPPSTRWT